MTQQITITQLLDGKSNRTKQAFRLGKKLVLSVEANGYNAQRLQYEYDELEDGLYTKQSKDGFRDLHTNTDEVLDLLDEWQSNRGKQSFRAIYSQVCELFGSQTNTHYTKDSVDYIKSERAKHQAQKIADEKARKDRVSKMTCHLDGCDNIGLTAGDYCSEQCYQRQCDINEAEYKAAGLRRRG